MDIVEQVQKTAQSQKDVEDFATKQADPRSGDSLVPMLVAGVVLTFGGMIAALAFTLRTQTSDCSYYAIFV
jgi:hypothetical protein